MSEYSRYVRDILPDVQSVAKKVARQWSDVVDAEDLEQDIWVRLLENSGGYIERTAQLDKPARLSLMETVAERVAVNSREDYEAFSGNHKYGSSQVKAILESGALIDPDTEGAGSNWSVGPEIKAPSSNPETDTLSETIDLNNGLADLYRKNENYWSILIGQYKDDQPVHEHRKDLTRAVDALTSCMNNYHRRRVSEYSDGPGTRKVITNDSARGVARDGYKGRD